MINPALYLFLYSTGMRSRVCRCAPALPWFSITHTPPPQLFPSLPSLLFFLLFFVAFYHSLCSSPMAAPGGWLCPSTMWVLGTERRLQLGLLPLNQPALALMFATEMLTCFHIFFFLFLFFFKLGVYGSGLMALTFNPSIQRQADL